MGAGASKRKNHEESGPQEKVKKNLITQIGTFELTQNCQNRDYVNALIQNKVLNPTKTIEEFLLDCNEPSTGDINSNVDFLGKGTFSASFKIKDGEVEKVIKFTHNLKRITHDVLDNERQGSFIQTYLLKNIKCRNICEIYEFGDYSFNPNYLKDITKEVDLTDHKTQKVNLRVTGFVERNREVVLLQKNIDRDGNQTGPPNTISNQYKNGVYAILEPFDLTLDDYDHNLKKDKNNQIISSDPIYNQIIITLKKIFYGIFSGLDCMSKQGYVHCDINFGNIGLKKDGQGNYIAKLFDFGFSKYLDETKYYPLNGTYGYVDPYTIDNGKKGGYLIHSKYDIYSVGVILYDMFTGLPVDSSNLEKGRKSIRREEIEGRVHDKDLQDLIINCLTVYTEERHTAETAMKSKWFNEVRQSDAAVAEQSPEDRTEDGPIWQEFIDPGTLSPYYINTKSGKWKWTHPLWGYETFYSGVSINEKILYLPEYFNNDQRVADPKLYGWTIHYFFSDGINKPIYVNPKDNSYYDEINPLVGYITLYNTDNGTKYYYDEENNHTFILNNNTNLNDIPLKTNSSLKDPMYFTKASAIKTGGRKKTKSKRSKRRRKTKRLHK